MCPATSIRRILPAAVVLLLHPVPASAQHAAGSWTLGLRAGTNVYLTSFNTTKLGPGLEASAAYDVSPSLSLGIVAGYEELKSREIPFPATVPYDYIKLHALQSSLVATLRPFPRAVAVPYLYGGVGFLTFQRIDGGKNFIPDESFRSSLIVPAGLGIEVPISARGAFVLDAGMRFGGSELDVVPGGGSGAFVSTKAGFRFFLSDPGTADSDGDGLTAAEEERAGTSDETPDSDGDGLTDGEEVHRYRSNPLSADSDGDGIPDGTEALTTGTDPARADTDGDGLPDRDELHIHRTSPMRSDTDGDGLQDAAELAAGADPLIPDTDGDGLSDRDEVLTFGSNPRLADTDGDGVNEGEEVHRHRSSPTRADSDGGGVADGVEIRRGMNPLNPADDGLQEGMVLRRGRTFILEGVGFQAGGAALTRDSGPALERLLVALLADAPLRVEIIGHTDGTGDPGANRRVSRARADVVKGWLVRRGIAAERLTASGMGAEAPVAPNTTAEGRAQNRRIEIRVLP